MGVESGQRSRPHCMAVIWTVHQKMYVHKKTSGMLVSPINN